jgi:hypothetical protein
MANEVRLAIIPVEVWMTYRGHIRNGVAVLDDVAHLPEGMAVIIQPSLSFGFRENLSIAELAKRQGVGPVTNTSDLAGDWPAEDSVDEFLAQVREGRR